MEKQKLPSFRSVKSPQSAQTRIEFPPIRRGVQSVNKNHFYLDEVQYWLSRLCDE